MPKALLTQLCPLISGDTPSILLGLPTLAEVSQELGVLDLEFQAVETAYLDIQHQFIERKTALQALQTILAARDSADNVPGLPPSTAEPENEAPATEPPAPKKLPLAMPQPEKPTGHPFNPNPKPSGGQKRTTPRPGSLTYAIWEYLSDRGPTKTGDISGGTGISAGSISTALGANKGKYFDQVSFGVWKALNGVQTHRTGKFPLSGLTKEESDIVWEMIEDGDILNAIYSSFRVTKEDQNQIFRILTEVTGDTPSWSQRRPEVQIKAS